MGNLKLPLKYFAAMRSIVGLIAIGVLTFSLMIAMTPNSSAQIPVLPTAPAPDTSQKILGWNPNQAYTCGRLLCSDVVFEGAFGTSLTLAKSLEPGVPEDEVRVAVENRATLVESTFASVLNTMLTHRFNDDLLNGGAIPDHEPAFYRQRTLNQFRHMARRSPSRVVNQDLHPDTPLIEVGVENNQTVVFVPAQEVHGLAQQSIVTVTEMDVLNAGSGSKDDLGEVWRSIIRQRLSDALWGQDYDWQYPLARLATIVGIAIAILVFLWGMNLLQKLLRSLRRRLKKRFKGIQQKLMRDVESAAVERPAHHDAAAGGLEQPGPKQNGSVPVTGDEPDGHSPPRPSHGTSSRGPSRQDTNRQANQVDIECLIRNPLGTVLMISETVQSKFRAFLSYLPKVSFDQQNMIRQQQNLLLLFLRSFFWLQVMLTFASVTLMVLVYPISRIYATFFLAQAIALPTIWMLVSLADIVVDFVIVRYLHRWAKHAQTENPSSNRYALRVSTYSPAIQGATTVIFIALGIYLTIRAFGINPAVLASAGFAAVVVAFLSRNLLEDMLNGALILWTDRYAVGDVIQVGTIVGLVENMNLYITQIRGEEGRLVTIPNGQIGIVENLTKDWSRVDFTIEIAHDADVGKALEIIEHVSEQMRSEESWSERILEPALILGVDQVTHAGILIQVWIRTQPIQQWAVGREFRLRIKRAFDDAGIGLGVPQRTISYANSAQALASPATVFTGNPSKV